MVITTYFSNQFRRAYAIRTGASAPILMRQNINPAELSEKLRTRLIGNKLELPSGVQFLYRDGRIESYIGSSECSGIKGLMASGEMSESGVWSGYIGSRWNKVRVFIWDHYEEPEATISAGQFEELFWATDALRIEDQRREEAEACAKRLADALAKAERLEKELAALKALNSASLILSY